MRRCGPDLQGTAASLSILSLFHMISILRTGRASSRRAGGYRSAPSLGCGAVIDEERSVRERPVPPVPRPRDAPRPIAGTLARRREAIDENVVEDFELSRAPPLGEIRALFQSHPVTAILLGGRHPIAARPVPFPRPSRGSCARTGSASGRT